MRKAPIAASAAGRLASFGASIWLGGSHVAGLARTHARASAGPSLASLAISERAGRLTVRFPSCAHSCTATGK